MKHVYRCLTDAPSEGFTPPFRSAGPQFDPLEPRRLMSTVQVFAAGDTGLEQAQLLINGAVVKTWDNVSQATPGSPVVTLSHDVAGTVIADQVRVAFTNDVYDEANGIDYNLRVDAIAIDGVRYESESADVLSTGTWTAADGDIVPGYGRGDTLHSNGHFQYAGGPVDPPVDPPAGSYTDITVYAAGETGNESAQLFVNGAVVQSWNNLAPGTTALTHRVERPVTADQVRVAFTNDVYDEANDIDYNLRVEAIALNGVRYDTLDPGVLSTGTWTAADGDIVPGYGRGDTLHSNGYFQYAGTTVHPPVNPPTTSPGTIGLTLDAVSVSEAAGQINFVVFRGGGTDGRVTVDYVTGTGTANGEDFATGAGTLVFENGIAGQQVSVAITNDDRVEGNESFTLRLFNPTGGATLGAITTQTVTIEDDDQVTNNVLFQDSFEGSTAWTTNPNGTDTATTGAWEAGAPTATQSGGLDLQPGAGHTGSRALVTGLAGGTTAGTYDIDGGVTSVVSPPIDLPVVDELELAFEYSFAYASNATGDDYFHAGVMINGDPIELYRDHAHNTDQAAGWRLIELDLSQFAGRTVQVYFAAADAAAGSLVEAAVDDVVVQVLPDLPGTIGVATPAVSVEESAGTADIRLFRNNGRVGEVTVNYTTVSGSATGNDFGGRSGTVTFADGQSEAFISVPVTDDPIEEPLETFTIVLSNPGGGALLADADVATVTIVDNDNATADYLPDLVPIASTLTERLSIDTSEQPGRQLMRFSTEIANAGTGPLEIWGGAASGSSQEVFQRIYQEGGGSRDILAGEFVYHPGHGHIHFEAFATYDLKLLNASGTVIASGGKTSFCLINIRNPLPDVTANAAVVHGRGGTTCGNVQGISTGYSDVYSASLDDQWIDVTGLSDGTYWLQITADPTNRILESDETNNVSQVRVTIANGQVSAA